MTMQASQAAVPVNERDPRATVEDFLRNLHLGDLAACCLAFSATAVIDEAESLPFGGVRIGPAGFADLVSAVGRLYKLRLGPPAIAASGNSVFVRFNVTLTSRRTGNWTEMPVVDVYTVKAGQITRLDVFYKDSAEVTRVATPQKPERGATTSET